MNGSTCELANSPWVGPPGGITSRRLAVEFCLKRGVPERVDGVALDAAGASRAGSIPAAANYLL